MTQTDPKQDDGKSDRGDEELEGSDVEEGQVAKDEKPQEDSKPAAKSDSDIEEGKDGGKPDPPEDDNSEEHDRRSALATLKPADRSEFPSAFYCPLTKKLIKDPVVAPDGITYERANILEKGEIAEAKLYTNKALRTVMEERIACSGPSLRAKLSRLNMSLRNGFGQLMEKSAIPSPDHRELTQSLYCPITLNLMHLPVIDPEGNTYEKAAIINWVRANKTSPLTRTPLIEEDLYENHAIEEVMDEEKNRSEDSLHSSVRRWQAEEPPKIPEKGDETTDAMPTTHEQLLEQRQTGTNCNVVALFLAAMVILLFVPYGSLVLSILIILVCCLPSRDSD